MKDLSEKVTAVYAILLGVYGVLPWTKKQILADMQQDSVDHFSVEKDKEMVGFLVTQQFVGELEITSVAVKKAYQGCGLGSQLLVNLDQIDFPIFLEVRASNISAQALYQKPGFRVIGERKRYYHNSIEDAVIMKREGNERQKRQVKDRYVLVVESSCDETSVTVLKNESEILSSIIASQTESHKHFGGTAPEVASRHHVEVVTTCFKDALDMAGTEVSDLDAVAVTYGPGLVGAILVGMAAAKAFVWAHRLPLIPVNHMPGHLMVARQVKELAYPLMTLLVSGGYTEPIYVSEPGDYEIVGEMHDDAVGEVYDKAGRVMGLAYLIGHEIDQLTHQGKDIYDFPCAMIRGDNLEFSFSGLKSAFINLYHNTTQKGGTFSKEDLSASFQTAVLDALMAKTRKTLEKYPVKTLVVAGGMAANQGLCERLADETTKAGVVILLLCLCGDNTDMISLAAAIECDKGHFADLDLNAKPSLAFNGLD